MAPIHWIVQHHATLESTNVSAHAQVLARWQSEQSAHGIVIVADTQSAGRGQHGRSFTSSRGGLYLSAIVESPPEKVRHLLALVAGVAAAAALDAAFDLHVQLRWPNDLILYEKKLGGILVESIAAGLKFAAIIGIGININTPKEDFAADLRPRVTSLCEHAGGRQDLGRIRSLILAGLSKTFAVIEADGLAVLVDAARRFDSLLGHDVELRDGERTITGAAAGIGPRGELLIQSLAGLTTHHTGSIITLDGKHIR